MSIKAQVQLIYLSKEDEQESQKNYVLMKILQRGSKKNQKPEQITPEKNYNSDHFSVMSYLQRGRENLKILMGNLL